MPSSPQVGTPQREFLLTTPSEGVSYVASTAENAGWAVEIVDMRGGVTAAQAAARAVARGGVVAMPTFADSFPVNEEVLDLVKAAAPALPTIVGGTLVSSLPDPVLKHLRADYAVMGEGELTLLELLDHLGRGGTPAQARHIAGLAMVDDDGAVVCTAPRPQIVDIDAVPIPNLSLYPAVQADPRIAKLGLTTARGCYGRCAFCFVNIRKMRFKSIDRVDEELRRLVGQHQVEYMYVHDLTFTADMDRTYRLAEVLGRSGVRWSCSTRVEKCAPELLQHMRRHGCVDIWYGIESLDQTVLDRSRKDQTVEEIEQAIRLTQAAGITVMTNLIVGLPGETVASLEKMLHFVATSDTIPASIKYLAPFPGTPIFDDAIKRGIIKDPIAYLRALAVRQVNNIDDEIYNITDLPDDVLRRYYRQIDELRRERVARYDPFAGLDGCAAAAPPLAPA